MNIDKQERIDAVNRYLKGDKPSNVCRDVNRSEKWLFKWINRFKTGEVEWYISHSRAPKKHGLKINKRERYACQIQKAYTLNPTQINEMHQVDLVGPRFIKGYGHISSINLIDVVSNQVHIEQYDSKNMDNTMAFLIQYWNNNPIPRYFTIRTNGHHNNYL